MFAFNVLLVGEAPSAPELREGLPDGLIDATAASGFDDAIASIEAGDVNCVVADYRLPSRNGIELLSRVREIDPTLPFVLHTADGDESVAEAAIDAGVTAYVPRGPSSPDPDIDALADRIVELARRDHVADTIEEPDPTAANLRLAQLTMDEAPVGITVADPTEPDEPLIYVNGAFERLTGYGKHETLGRNCRFLQGEGTDPETVATVREAIDDERPVSVELRNYRKSGEPFWNRLEIAPIRDDGGDVTHLVGFQSDVTERKEIELRAKRQAEKLRADRRTRERLLARLDGTVRRVTTATVTSTSRAELQDRVCEAVTETTDYEAAWIGTRQMTSDRIVADSQADCGSTDAIQLSSAGDGDPVSEADRTDRVVTAEISSLPSGSVHRQLASSDGGVAAVPIRYREADYGVLVVYATRYSILDEHETAVLEALGRVVGTGLNALQNHRLLATDEYLELVFRGGPPGPTLVELAAEADCELTYRGAIQRSDGRFGLSVLASDVDLETLQAAAEKLPRPPGIKQIASYDEDRLLEVTPEEPSLIQTALDHNGTLRALTAGPAGGTLRIELPRSADPGGLVQTLLDRYDGLSLDSQRQREHDADAGEELVETLRQDLTARQLETVQKAFLSDYFEWPRPVSGEKIADSMGITRSTFHQHLRAAESKILDALLEELQPTARSN